MATFNAEKPREPVNAEMFERVPAFYGMILTAALDRPQTTGSIGYLMKIAAGPKPILKWAGGKQIVARALVERFPRDFGTYYEPFVGGGSVLLTLGPPKAVIGDLNDWLLDTYVAVRRDWKRVAAHLDALKNTREDYLRIRHIDPAGLDLFERAAHLIYLNKTCFRGLFRVNRHGRFNVPYGAYDRRYYDPDNLRGFAAALKRVEIRRHDFERCIQDASREDFVYFDPPYHKLGGYSDFNRYTPGQFREDDHLRLAAVCRALDRRKIRWALTNSDTGFVRELYAGFRLARISNRREINLSAKDRTIFELLVTNY
jgi:DNA adenine methylase